MDFFGNPRPTISGDFDPGAVEFQGAASAVLTVTPSSLTFGSTVVGTTSGSQLLTLSNTGTATASGINVTPSAGFVVSSTTCGTTLVAGTTCQIRVAFQPTKAGTATGTVTIAASVTVNNSPVALTGTGAEPTVTLTQTSGPTGGNFGNVVVGTTSSTTEVLRLAAAGGPVNYNIAVLTNGFVHVTTGGGNCAFPTGTLAAGTNCNIRVAFSPTASGLASSSVTVTATDNYSNVLAVTGSPAALSGTGVVGVPNMSITNPGGGTTKPYNFGTGTARRNATFTLRNIGTGPFLINSISAAATTSVNGSSYSVTVGTCAVNGLVNGPPPGAGGTCTIIVTFNPGTTGTSTTTGTLTVTGVADGGTTTITVSRGLTGTR